MPVTISNPKPVKVIPKIVRLRWITSLLLFILMFVRMLSLEILDSEDCWDFGFAKNLLAWIFFKFFFSLPKVGVGFAGKRGTKTPREESQAGVWSKPSLLLAGAVCTKEKTFPMKMEIPDPGASWQQQQRCLENGK